MTKPNNIIETPHCTECDSRCDNQLFNTLSVLELDKTSKEKGGCCYKKGQHIFTEGTRGHGLYCVYKGKVKIHKLGVEAKEQIVRFAKEGDVIGYRSLLSNEPYYATASALEDSILCYISKKTFLEMLENNKNLSYNVIQMLTQNLKESEKKIINLKQKPVIQRVSESLLILKEKFGLTEDGYLTVKLSRREIGDLSGVTTETTIRTLSELNKKGIIHLKGKSIGLVNMSRLVETANIYD
ncbi:MAG: Crp/Fnr family transcriptional regulator [Flavobacteriales bacterium]|nr:Crp/Fnr family transcriptional regulator [Flavobacteriales bacterium]